MNRRIVIIGIVILLLGFFLIKKPNPTSPTFSIEGKQYNLLVADTPNEWTRGLMDVRKLDGADGMMFIFPDKAPRTFWNKNTYIDLDIIWMNDETVIGKSYLPSIEKTKQVVAVTSPGPANRVVELIK